MTLRVLIADDHRIFRESLRCMLDLDPELTVVGTAASGDEVIERAHETHPDVICMDIMMPGLDGIEATRRLAASEPGARVIGLSAYPDRHYVLDMLNAGARGYVTKSEAPEELRTAIRSVCQDEIYFCPEVSGALLDPANPLAPYEHPAPLHMQASSREAHELLARIGEAASRRHPAPPAEELFWLRQIVEGSSLPSFVLDRRHRVIYWNKACEVLTGIPAGEVVGTGEHWRAFHDEAQPLLADLILQGADERTLRERYPGNFRLSPLVAGACEAEVFFPRLGKQGAWLYLTGTPIHDARHRVVGAIQTLQDFTVRHRAEEMLQQSEARYRQLSITDNLTGLYNPRHFYAQLKTEIGRAIRYGHPLSLLILDVDDFKHYNDSYGHLEGDEVLRRLAGVIRETPRLGDSGYRIGGEEFAILMPDTDLDRARLAAERLRGTFAALDFTPAAEVHRCCSVSIGVTSYRPYEKFTTLVRRADGACYRAKRQGKNCVVVD